MKLIATCNEEPKATTTEQKRKRKKKNEIRKIPP
jgi:hypothetical protein